jgi:hypothetical protein
LDFAASTLTQTPAPKSQHNDMDNVSSGQTNKSQDTVRKIEEADNSKVSVNSVERSTKKTNTHSSKQ